MSINVLRSLSAVIFSAVAVTSFAASVTVNGVGSNIVINKIGGFDGVDGTAREAAFVAAAKVWADILVSPVDIVVDAQFSSSLFCNANSATLGSAGPLSTYFGSGAEAFNLQSNVWYPTALVNAHYGSDKFPANADISAEFNADLGDADCLSASGWYYGTDGNAPAGDIDFYEVVLHELGHGLGILSLVNSDGTNNGGVIDIYTSFLKDQSTAKQWSAMSAAERNVSVVNNQNVVWSGANVTALAGQLSSGVNAGNVQMYAPNPYEGGSSISHFDTALTPNELMEPQYTGGATWDHSKALLADIGWPLYVAANDVPEITGQSALVVNEDDAIILAISHLTVSDSDNNYPADFSLTVESGVNYSVSGTTITPAENFNGQLSVPVKVSDGEDSSATFNLQVTVNPINDPPIILAQSALTIDEDNALTLNLNSITVTDPDDSEFSLDVLAGDHYEVSGVTITPSEDFNGQLSVPVKVSDGEDSSATFNLQVTVNPVNDTPVLTAQSTLTVAEDNDLTLSINHLTIVDPDDSAFTLVVLAGDNYEVSGAKITPDNNFNGQLSVPVQVSDGKTSSATFNLQVTVNPVNDAPVISAQRLLGMSEGGSITLSIADLTIDDVDDSLFTLSINSGQDYTVNGLTLTPSAEFSGELQVPVFVNDGEIDSSLFGLVVSVASENDIPVITGMQEITVNEDESFELSISDFSIFDVDSAEHILSIGSGEFYSVIGNRVTPSKDFNGQLSVAISVSDAFDSSEIEWLEVTVVPVNDAPILSGEFESSVVMLNQFNASFVASDIDSEELSFSLNTEISWLNIDNSGNLSGLAAPSDIGTQPVTVTVSDGELQANLTFNLVVLDETEVDISVTTTLGASLLTLNEQVQVTTTLSNRGPAVYADGRVEIEFPVNTTFNQLDDNCTLALSQTLNCNFTNLTTSQDFINRVSWATEMTAAIETQAAVQQSDPVQTNNLNKEVVYVVAQLNKPTVSIELLGAASTQAVQFSDIDNDGKKEVAFANKLPSNESLFQLSNQYDSTTLLSNIQADTEARDLAFADFNRDGLNDIAFANSGVNRVYLNHGDGRFSEAQLLGDARSLRVISVDLNNDNYPDLVFANDGENTIYLNDQTGQFNHRESFGVAISQDIDTLDYNQDGFADLVVANSDDDDYVYLNRGADQTLSVLNPNAIIIGTVQSESSAISVADFDGDGLRDDILIGRKSKPLLSSLEIYSLTGNVLQSMLQIPSAGINAVESADYDADGDTDLLLLTTTGVAQVLESTNGQFLALHTFYAEQTQNIFMADINGDDKADMALLNTAGHKSELFISDRSFVPAVIPTQESGVTPDAGEPPAPAPDESNDSNAPPVEATTVVQSGAFTGHATFIALFFLLVVRTRTTKSEV